VKNRNSGFTLIELIIVIVILGLLSVTAAPKFLNIQDDTVKSVLKAVDGSLNSAMPLVFGKALMENSDKEREAKVDGVDIRYGYPLATETGIESIMNIDLDEDGNGDFSYVETVLLDKDGALGLSKSIVIYHNEKVKSDNCFIAYTQADANKIRTIWLLI